MNRTTLPPNLAGCSLSLSKPYETCEDRAIAYLVRRSGGSRNRPSRFQFTTYATSALTWTMVIWLVIEKLLKDRVIHPALAADVDTNII